MLWHVGHDAAPWELHVWHSVYLIKNIVALSSCVLCTGRYRCRSVCHCLWDIYSCCCRLQADLSTLCFATVQMATDYHDK